MINSRIYGSNALKLHNQYTHYNRNTYITHEVKRKHKWRPKQSCKNFYIAVGNVLGLLGIMFCVLIFTFGVGMFL